MDIRTDILVIGSGPGGEGAAMKAAKCGHEVVMIDAQLPVGGNCTHKGTIPSKALRQVIREAVGIRKSALSNDMKPVTFNQLRTHAKRVIDKQTRMRSDFYARNDITLLEGFAHFVDEHHVQVCQDNGGCLDIGFNKAVVATGSRPYRPDSLDFSHPQIRDSDTILDLESTLGLSPLLVLELSVVNTRVSFAIWV